MEYRSSSVSPVFNTVEVSDSAYSKMQLGFSRKELVPVEQVKITGDAYRAIVNYSKNPAKFIWMGIGLYMYGEGGVGKSFALACLAYELRQLGASVLRVTAQRAMECLTIEDRASYSSEMTMADRMRDVHILIVDGLGTEYQSNKSTFSSDKFLDLLAFRKQQPYAATWFTSSLSPHGQHSEFRRRYSDTLCDFMPEVAVPLLVEGQNHRKATAKSLRQELLG